MTKLIHDSNYQDLLEHISRTYTAGRAAALQAVNTQLVNTYWQVTWATHCGVRAGWQRPGRVRRGTDHQAFRRLAPASRQGFQPQQPHLHAPAVPALSNRSDAV